MTESMIIQLIAVNCRYSHSCLALFYVRQQLERHLPKAQTRFRQFTINDPYYPTLLRISTPETTAFFFSVYIWNHAYLHRLLTDLHQLRPQTPIVLGGPQALVLREALNFQPTVVDGEIEGVKASFYTDLREGRLQIDYQCTPGSSFRSPYKRDDFCRQLKNRNIYYESSRGCPFSCSYCLSSVGRGVVNRDLQETRKELTAILRHQPQIIRFVDRTFNADGGRALAIWRFLSASHAESPATSFHFEIAPGLFNEEMFEFLEGLPAGLFQFEIGIQSTNNETLKAVNRVMDLKKASTNIRRLTAMANIHLHIDLILGLPHDTRQTFGRSLNDVFALGPHYIQMGLLKVLPGTTIHRRRRQFGLMAAALPPYEILATKWLEDKELGRLFWLGECLEAFHNNRFFTTFFNYLRQIDEDILFFFSELSDFCQKRGFFQLANTQALLTETLVEFTARYPGTALIREVLLYDWLHAGGRRPPPCLQPVDMKGARDYLWHHLPDEVEGLFTQRQRHAFFKKAIFQRFSVETLKLAGHNIKSSQPEAYAAFLPVTTGLLKHQETRVILKE